MSLYVFIVCKSLKRVAFFKKNNIIVSFVIQIIDFEVL